MTRRVKHARPLEREGHAEALANADGSDELRAVLEELLLMGLYGAPLHPPPTSSAAADAAGPTVFLARDTRPTGPALAAAAKAGGVIENKHSTDVKSPPPPLRVCMSIHPQYESSSDLGSSAVSQ